jgi:hypothetical protein
VSDFFRGVLLFTLGWVMLVGMLVLSVLPIWYIVTHEEGNTKDVFIFVVLWFLPALWLLLWKVLPIPARWLVRDPYDERDQ